MGPEDLKTLSLVQSSTIMRVLINKVEKEIKEQYKRKFFVKNNLSSFKL